jgi:predicted transport protein
MAKSPEEMEAAMVANMKEKTGKTLPQWLKIAKAAKLEKHGQIVKHLKGEHGMTHGFANLVAHYTLRAGTAAPAGDDLVGTQYSGKKEGLRPIYDALLAVANKLGADVEVAPKKAYVSLRRSKQFAIIQPSTATRVDLGLNLKGEPTTKRLEASGSFNAMVSHRVRLETKKDVNAEVKAWLKQAYSKA